MIKRPKPGEDEEDILRMQEEYLRNKDKNPNQQPAAQVVNLRRNEAAKRPSTSDTGGRKPSKYAQSKGLTNHADKRARTEPYSSLVGDVFEKNTDECEQEEDPDYDKVYYPKVIPSLLGNIVEKNVNFSNLDFTSMPSKGFPVVSRRDPSVTLSSNKKSIHALQLEMSREINSMQMDVDVPTQSSKEQQVNNSINLPSKSYILNSKDAVDIHNENITVLSQMKEEEILEEQQKLLSSLNPDLVQFLRSKRKLNITTHKTKYDVVVNEELLQLPEPTASTCNVEHDTLWENDVLTHPQIEKWLHFDSLEKDKLEWMKGIEESKAVNPDEPFEARFDFKGYLLPYTLEYTEKTKTLFHHGEEPHRPGYTLTELFELTRSSITQQRVMALNTIAGILEYYVAGTYKNIIEVPLSKVFFVIRIAVDENKVIVLEPALKAMRNLFYNRIDEASLDALLGFEEGTQQPSLVNDKSEIEELESAESEFIDYHLAEIDLVTAILRTDVLQRLYYIIDVVRPNFNCIQYALQILIRLARDSAETAAKIVETSHLMQAIIGNFLPNSDINFVFNPQIVYNGKPVLAAIKLLRILSLQSKEISDKLISDYDILKPISQYVSSTVDGTYGLRMQIEAVCALSNLLHFQLGVENAISLCPIIVTTLFKHVHGTDVYPSSSIIAATHAAIVLQFVNKLLNCQFRNVDNIKYQVYPLLKEGVQKWLTQLANSVSYTCGHLRLICAALDCCKTMLIAEQLQMKFLNDSLRLLSDSQGFKSIISNLTESSNLMSGIDNGNLHLTKNLMSLGASVIDSKQKVLPVLNVVSPVPFLASLFKLLVLVNDIDISRKFTGHLSTYITKFVTVTPCLFQNWFSRIETDFLFAIVKLTVQSNTSESHKDLLYIVASKLCYILRIDKKSELEYLFNNVMFNKQWFTAERLLNLMSLQDTDGLSRALASVDDIKQCYSKVVNLNYVNTAPNVILRQWQQPILPRDWIYLPILTLYSKSQDTGVTPRVFGEHAKKLSAQRTQYNELIVGCSLEWILFNELCFPDLLDDIDITDRFCRILCVFLCDTSLFLENKIKLLLRKCTQNLFKKKSDFNFDKQLTGLNNFQDFYTQLLEQFQSVSYGDHTFASCVLVPLAQKHNVKWRKLIWSEYAGCLRALDCPEELLCYELNEYLFPEETDESLVKSYHRALSNNLVRQNTVAYKIANHHIQAFKKLSKLL